jgi:hypothetical protein
MRAEFSQRCIKYRALKALRLTSRRPSRAAAACARPGDLKSVGQCHGAILAGTAAPRQAQ